LELGDRYFSDFRDRVHWKTLFEKIEGDRGFSEERAIATDYLFAVVGVGRSSALLLARSRPSENPV
jgi:hypothetical protein